MSSREIKHKVDIVVQRDWTEMGTKLAKPDEEGAMFDWLRKIMTKQKPLLPESQWTVVIDEGSIRIVDHAGVGRLLLKRDLKGIAIETNDSGPWGTDLWWLLFDMEGKLGGAVPGGATGESDLVDYVMTLPGFEPQQLSRAMASTDNAVFKLWERPDLPDA